VAASADDSDQGPWPYDPTLGMAGSRLKAALSEANRRIGQESLVDVERRGMATTTSALLVPPTATPWSRTSATAASTLARGHLRRVTTDHSWWRRRCGPPDGRADASAHPWRNIVMRALSGTEPAEIDVFPCRSPRRLVLLCSDGLTAVVREDRIAAAVAAANDPTALCEHLVDLANDNGGPDNITVVASTSMVRSLRQLVRYRA